MGRILMIRYISIIHKTIHVYIDIKNRLEKLIANIVAKSVQCEFIFQQRN